MMTLLFWNMGANPRGELIARLAADYEVDIILLAEVCEEPIKLLLTLNRSFPMYSYAPGIGNTKIEVFVQFPESYARPLHESDRLTIRRINPPGIDEILLAVVHFPSKLHWDEDSQAFECTLLADVIRKTEDKAGHRRTVLVGDLNMNPFESGVVSAAGMHAVMVRRVAIRESRTVQVRDYPFFYNPIWGLFGDGSRGPSGTFYYPQSVHKAYFWNMFDQVLIRPSLLNRFRFEDLKNLQHRTEHSLLTDSGIPDQEVGSDHFPILFRLSL